MNRFGRFQRYTSDKLQRMGALGTIYSVLVGYTDVPSLGRFLWFRRALRNMPKSPKQILDAGCGCGEYAFYFAKKYPDASVRAIDVDPVVIGKCERVRSRFEIENVEFVVEDLTSIADRDKWDLIYSVDVLEHVLENREILETFYSALKPGGYLYVRIPSAVQHRIMPAHLFRSHDEWAAEEHIAQHFDYETLTEYLKSIGFEIVYAARTNGVFGKLAFEVGHVLSERATPVFAVAVPCLKVLSRLDVLCGPKRVGNGVIVLARRPSC